MCTLAHNRCQLPKSFCIDNAQLRSNSERAEQRARERESKSEWRPENCHCIYIFISCGNLRSMIYELPASFLTLADDGMSGCFCCFSMLRCVINQQAMAHFVLLIKSHTDCCCQCGSMHFGADEHPDKCLCFRNKSFISRFGR